MALDIVVESGIRHGSLADLAEPFTSKFPTATLLKPRYVVGDFGRFSISSFTSKNRAQSQTKWSLTISKNLPPSRGSSQAGSPLDLAENALSLATGQDAS
ncbi:hypothetical protein PGT21_001776 [Puccinia graminis f. sp. tritici]|uniref:Uncharacterized protein n=1 Tax=Puccinia graminis f. sp. tritici TaxID=56615 RepID=A0A5B0Q4G8_PUCGR|nr:hypothetical protein PGT21_001776 [Puccinia graminis f. sp. tritici]